MIYNELCRKHIPYAVRRINRNMWEVLNRDYLPISPEAIKLTTNQLQVLIDNASPISVSTGETANNVDMLTIFCERTWDSGEQLSKLCNCLKIILSAKQVPEYEINN